LRVGKVLNRFKMGKHFDIGVAPANSRCSSAGTEPGRDIGVAPANSRCSSAGTEPGRDIDVAPANSRCSSAGTEPGRDIGVAPANTTTLRWPARCGDSAIG
jgi:hypothetical protein